MFIELTPDEIRACGFEPWDGTKPGPPKDWLREWKVLHRPGYERSLNTESRIYWEHDKDDPSVDIIGYPTTESKRHRTMDIINLMRSKKILSSGNLTPTISGLLEKLKVVVDQGPDADVITLNPAEATLVYRLLTDR